MVLREHGTGRLLQAPINELSSVEALPEATQPDTGCNYWDAFHTTLVIYRGRLYPRRQTTGRLSWVLPVRNYGMLRQAFSQQFCPACHSPIMLYRGDFGRELKDSLPMHVCSVCGTDLSGASRRPAVFPNEPLQEFHEAALRSIATPIAPNDRFDLGFFRVLRHLCYVICSSQDHRLLLQHVIGKLGRTETPLLPEGRIGVEDLRRDMRHQVLLSALWLMEDLEGRLTEAWRARTIRFQLALDQENKSC